MIPIMLHIFIIFGWNKLKIPFLCKLGFCDLNTKLIAVQISFINGLSI